MSDDPKAAAPRGKNGRPKSSRNKRTIARLTAKERIPARDGKTRTATYIAVLSTLQQRAAGKDNVEAAKLWDQVADALHPEAGERPSLFIIVPDIATHDDWERMAAPTHAATKALPLLQRIKLNSGKNTSR